MSLRLRIFLAFALLALLPALPVTWAVQNLIDKSFEVGLSPEVQAGLEGGADAARRWLRAERDAFRRDLAGLAARSDELGELFSSSETLAAATLPAGKLLLLGKGGRSLASRGEWPAAELAWLGEQARSRREGGSVPAGRPFFPQGFDRRSLRAVLPLAEPAGASLLVSRPIDAEFLEDFEGVVGAQQLLAGLRLETGSLRRGFVYPFVLVYLVVLAGSLLTAWLLSRRLTRRLAALSDGARRIGEGDWTTRVVPAGKDEIGRLIAAFNQMVSRLEGQRRRLTDLEKMAAWREMARSLAHEIKNPLTPITLAVQEMRDRYPGGDEEHARFLTESGRIIEDEIESLRRLSREFSEFARTPEMHKQPADLPALIRDLAALYGSVPVRLELDEAMPDFDFDPEQMRRALSNLFENAVAALAGTPEDKREIVVRCRASEDAVQLDFDDTGPGIPKGIRGRVFEPHFTTKGGGMGLGLALVSSVVSLHGGAVSLADGPGARFRIVLPLADAGGKEKA